MIVEEKELETPEAEDKPETDSEATLEAEADSAEKAEVPVDADKAEKPETPEPKAEGKKPYTSEELEELLASEGEIDSSRLSPEGRLLQKSFQRGYGEKFERLAEERRNLKAETQPVDPKEAYYQKYQQDPEGVVAEVTAEVGKLMDAGEFDKAIRLQGVVSQFQARATRETRQDGVSAQFDNAIVKEIPDIDQLVPKLNEYAQNELGYTAQQLNAMTNPSIVGVDLAVKNIKAIARLYKSANASKTVQKKVKKPTPPPLERGGPGGGEPTETKPPDKMSMPEFNAWMDKREKPRR